MRNKNKVAPVGRTILAVITTLILFLAGCSTSLPEVSVGQPAPDFSLPTADGGTVALSDYLGQRPVLLYFHMAVG